MVEYKIDESALILEIRGWDRIWSLKGMLKINFDKINGIRRIADGDRPPWLRAPGTYWPNLITAGTYHGKGKKEFWCTRHKKNTVVIDLTGEDYTRVVVDIYNNIDGLIDYIQSKIT